jgi:hypothetical protein
LHPKPIKCIPVESCDNLRKWKCILGKCNDCPKAQFHHLEQSQMQMLTTLSDSNTTKITPNAPSTEFLNYVPRVVIDVRKKETQEQKLA